MGAFIERLDAAGRGEGGLVLIAGEPGIGKTRLCDELIATARRRGFSAAVGQCHETEADVPYGPFVHLIEQVLDAGGGASALTGLESELALLLPELRSFSAKPAPFDVPASERRHLLFKAVRNFLGRQAAVRPLLLVLEDLQWADASSLVLLQHIADDIPRNACLLLATYRDTDVDASHPLARVLEDVQRLRLAENLLLKPLSRPDIAAILTAYGGAEAPPAIVSAVFQETEGNAYFVEEVIRHLGEQGKLLDAQERWFPDVASGDLEVPRNVKLVVERRLGRLSAACRHALASAAVIGRDFDFALLKTVVKGDILEPLEEAQNASMVREIPVERGARYRFVHELVRQTLLASLSHPRRQQLHLDVARAISERDAGRTDQRAAELAYHLFEAGDAADSREAARWLTLAGDQAVAGTAFDEGLKLYARALRLVEGMPQGDERRSWACDLHAKRGAVLYGVGRWGDSAQELEAALVAHPEEDDKRARILRELCLTTSWGQSFPRTREHAADLARLAERLARSDLAAEAMATQGVADVSEGNVVAGEARLRTAIRQTQEMGLPPPAASAHFGGLLYWRGQLQESLLHSERAAARARDFGDALGLVYALDHQGAALGASGRYQEATAAFREAEQLARERRSGWLLARTVSFSTGYHLDLFDFPGAEARAEEARELARSAPFPMGLVSATFDLLFLAIRRGDVGVAERLMPQAEKGVTEVAGFHQWNWRVRGAQAQAELALARRNWRDALRLSEESLAVSRRFGRVRYEIMGLDTLAAALVRVGRRREAISQLRHALDLARKMGDPALFLRAACSLLRIAGDDALLSEARDSARRIASALPDETMLQRFQEAEAIAPLLADKAERQRESLSRGGLTAREAEVLRLLALGNSSREIGAALVLSVRTVERHIANIYLKTNTHSRAQATAYAIAHDLI